jgi:hypothetical protein
MSDKICDYFIRNLKIKNKIDSYSFGVLAERMGILSDNETLNLIFKSFKENDIEIVGVSYARNNNQEDYSNPDVYRINQKLRGAYSKYKILCRITNPDPEYFKSLLKRTDEIVKRMKFSNIEKENNEDE